MPPRLRRIGAVVLSTACVTLGSATAADAVTVTKSFSPTGAAQTFDVPTGITEVEVTAVGGRGGGSGGDYGESADRVPGGFGGRVTGTLTVTPGSRLWVAVGGNGASACPPGTWDPGSPGGWNGGAAGGTASCGVRGGSGGGASDVRTCEPGTECPDEPGADPLGRLLVAAGGGGTARWANSVAGAGGNAEAAGGSTNLGPRGTGGGGGAGTATAGGAPGESGEQGTPWEPTPAGPGTLGVGGIGGTGISGAHTGGGGGGGGLYGGGGGGSANYYGGGGGGGSNLVPAGTSAEVDTTGDPVVRISFEAGDPSTIDAPTVEDTSLHADGASTTTVTVVVRDDHGVPVPGGDVSFSATAPQPQIGPTTDHGDGTYSATVTTASTRGTTTITARLASPDRTSGPVSLLQVDRPAVTSPSHGTPVLDPTGGPATITVAGTADPLTSSVTVRCVTRSGLAPLDGAEQIPVANGRWSAGGVTLPEATSHDALCRLVVTADGTTESSPEELPGPIVRRVGLERYEEQSGVHGFFGSVGGTLGLTEVGALGQDCDLTMSLFRNQRFGTGPTWLECGATPSGQLDGLDALIVDGRVAFTAAAAANADDWLGNQPSITVDTAIGTDGALVVTERGPVHGCPATGTCETLVATGVTATVRTTVAESGTTSTRTIDFASTDGQPHDVALTLRSRTDYESPQIREGDATAWRPLTDPVRRSDAPSRHTVQFRDGDDPEAPALAITAVPGPVTQLARNREVLQRFARPVPADGVAGIAMRFDLTDGDAIAAAAKDARDAYAVGVEIETPATGTSTEADRVTLAGTVFDRSGDVTLRVGGQPIDVAENGRWTASFPLEAGRNTFDAVVESRYGVRETATVVVTRTVPVPPTDPEPPTDPTPPGGPTLPAVPTPAATKPQLLRKVTVPKRARLAQIRKRGLAIPLTLSGAQNGRTRITAELRGKWGVVARGTATATKRGTATLRLKPSRKAAAKAASALRRSKTVKLQLKLTVRDAGGATQTVTRTVQLRR